MKKLLLLLAFTLGELSANPNPFDPVIRSQITAYQRHAKMMEQLDEKNWEKLVWACEDMLTGFPTSPLAREASYYLGEAYYHLGEFEASNKAFSAYLKESKSPKFFDEAIRYKFAIAKALDGGARLHLFGWKRLPKWVSGYEEAIEIYDSVIASLPRDDLAAESLYRKGLILLQLERYTESADALQALIRRFPKHPLAIEGYIARGKVFLTECKKEFLDLSKLELAEINVRQFRAHFPGEPRLYEAEKQVQEMKEQLATDLLEIAEFYERTKKQGAAEIYYGKLLKKYPDTQAGKKAAKKLPCAPSS